MRDSNVEDDNVIKFLQQIKAEPDDWANFLTARCGLHSGIPKCCVAHFVKVMMPLWDALPDNCLDAEVYDAMSEAEQSIFNICYGYMFWWRPTDKQPEEWPAYTPCPSCLINNTIVPELKKCNCVTKRDKIAIRHDKALERAGIESDEDEDEEEIS